MIILSRNYINKLRTIDSFDLQIRNELFCSFLFNSLIASGNYSLGSEGKYPDLINKTKTIGYEITQCDLDVDLNLKYISECLIECSYNYELFLEKIKKTRICIKDYSFVCEKNKVVAYGPTPVSRDPFYFIDNFKIVIQKKLNKLQSKYYEGCSSTSLIVFCYNRKKTDSDVKKMFETYFELINENKTSFANLYIVTSDGIYKNTSDYNFVKTAINNEIASSCILLTNKVISSVISKKSLYSEAPELCLDWGKNDKSPLDFSLKSGEKVWWVCDKGHSYDAVINKRTMRNNGCPYCSGHRVMPGFNDLETTHPVIAKQWHPTKNGNLKPSSLSKGSMQVVWWMCKNGHSYQNNVNAKKEGNDCPYCNHRIVEPGVTDLATTNPELAKEWHPTKNGTLKPTDVFEKSDKKVWWLCKEGHSYQASIHHRSTDKTCCPECIKERKVSFPEKLLFFYLNNSFDNVLENYNPGLPNNGNIDIFLKDYNIGIEYDGAHWHKNKVKDIQKNENCKKLGIDLIRIREKGCVELSSTSYDFYIEPKDYASALSLLKKGLFDIAKLDFKYDFNIEKDSVKIDELIFSKTKENSLLNYPLLLEEWDYEKNKGINPSFVSCGSDKQFWWKCKSGHTWKTSVLNRTKGKGCPFCCNRLLLKGYNDLATTNPELLIEWDYEKNNKKPEEVMKGSAQKVWWKCKHGHSYNIEIREKKEKYCPVCEMNIIQRGVNDLATSYPSLMNEWDYEKNLGVDPTILSPFSVKKVWWKCNNCGHSWAQRIYSRTKQSAKCPKCQKKIIKRTNSRKILNIETGAIYNSLSEASISIGKEQGLSLISDCCKGKRKSAYGYHWKFVD